MRNKYITTIVLLACLSKSNDRKKDIHTQLRETIAEHRRIMREFEKKGKEQHGLLVNMGKEAA